MLTTAHLNDSVHHPIYGDGIVELCLGCLHCLVRFVRDNSLKTVSASTLSVTGTARTAQNCSVKKELP